MKGGGAGDDAAEGLAMLQGARVLQPARAGPAFEESAILLEEPSSDAAAGRLAHAGLSSAQADSLASLADEVLVRLALQLQRAVGAGARGEPGLTGLATELHAASPSMLSGLSSPAQWYGTTVQPLVGGQEATLLGLRVTVRLPPSTHSNLPWLSHSTVTTLLAGGQRTSGSEVARLWKQSAGGSSSPRASNDKGDPIGSFNAGAAAANVPCATLGFHFLPFEFRDASESGEGLYHGRSVGCRYNTAKMLGLYSSSSSGVDDMNKVDPATAGAPPVIANEGWDLDPLQTVGIGVGISSTLLPAHIASRSRWHSLHVARRARNGTHADTEVAVTAIVEVPRALALKARAAGGVLPLAVLLGLTHEDDFSECFQVGNPQGRGSNDESNEAQPRLEPILRSCPMVKGQNEVRIRECGNNRSNSSSGGAWACGWSSYPLASLHTLALKLPVSGSTPQSPAPFLIERRLSAPLLDGGGLGGGTLLELATVALPSLMHFREQKQTRTAVPTAVVDHILPWFATPVDRLYRSGSRKGEARIHFRTCDALQASKQDGMDVFVDLDAAPAASDARNMQVHHRCYPSQTETDGINIASIMVEHRYSIEGEAEDAELSGHSVRQVGPPILLRSTWVVSANITGIAAVNALQQLGGSMRVRFSKGLRIAAPALMHAEALPPDTHRGLEIPSAHVSVTLEGAVEGAGRSWRYPLGTLIFEPHSPDFAMPYNVMVLTGTAVAFVLGQMVNILARAKIPAAPTAAGGAKKKLLARIRDKCRRNKVPAA